LFILPIENFCVFVSLSCASIRVSAVFLFEPFVPVTEHALFKRRTVYCSYTVILEGPPFVTFKECDLHSLTLSE